MPLFNKQKRIQYIGFNDFWFSIIGIILVSIIANYLFNNPGERPTKTLVLIGWIAALVPVIIDWILIRHVLIFLRKKYPDFKDDVDRISHLLFAIVTIIILVDFVMGAVLAQLFTFLGYPSTHRVVLKIMVPVIIIVIMIMAIYEAIYYNLRLKTSIREEEQAKQVMIQAQLDTFRNQAQPHFLFNSLNTLRDIIDYDTKEDAKAFVDNLSRVYRFIIESGNANLIALEKELTFAKAYIHIQTERFGDNLQLHWDIPDTQQAAMIVPMSLQLLLENAIKHNVVSKAKPLVIQVTTKENHLVIRNKIQPKSTQTPSTKVGLKNIEKRYQLISGQLPIIDNDGTHFTVSLPLLKAAH